MADVATVEAPVTSTPASGSPAETAAPLTPQVETTTDERRGEAPAPRAESAESQTPPAEAAPKPSLTELLKDPDFKQQYDGHTGERIRRERLAAQQEAEQRFRDAQTQQFQQHEQQQLNEERMLREREDAELRRLNAAGDPYELSRYWEQVQGRRDAIEAQWRATETQRRAAFEQQQRVTAAVEAERKSSERAMEAYFRSLPLEVQKEVAGRQYFHVDPAESRRQALADWREADQRYQKAQGDADIEKRVEAEIKKRLAKMNLSVEDFDQGGGGPVSGSPYRYQEEAEAALRKGEITAREFATKYRDRLPYRRGR